MNRMARLLPAVALLVLASCGTAADQAAGTTSPTTPATLPSTTAPTTTAPPTTAPPSSTTSRAPVPAVVDGEAIAYGRVEVTGSPIARLPEDGTDPSAGARMPEVVGADFAGNTVSIVNDGQPKIILFLTHW